MMTEPSLLSRMKLAAVYSPFQYSFLVQACLNILDWVITAQAKQLESMPSAQLSLYTKTNWNFAQVLGPCLATVIWSLNLQTELL
jgi:hypothetical protein